MRFDLHIHSYYSDGRYSPEEIIDIAYSRNLSGISITDHDTIASIDRAVNYGKDINEFYIIPGIEFSCMYNKSDVHILGYIKNYKHPKLIKKIKYLSESRKRRGMKIISKLNRQGIMIDYKDLLKNSNQKFVGRVPIAKALIQNNYVSTIEEGFDKYLIKGKMGYVEKESFSISETIRLIKSVGGISILAHPGQLNNMNIVEYCIQCGIDGLESIHPSHNEEEVKKFRKIALRNNLIETGGSDCHGDIVKGDLLLGKYYIDLNKMPKLKEMII